MCLSTETDWERIAWEMPICWWARAHYCCNRTKDCCCLLSKLGCWYCLIYLSFLPLWGVQAKLNFCLRGHSITTWTRRVERGLVKCPRYFISLILSKIVHVKGEGVKNDQNLVHEVIRWPLMKNYVGFLATFYCSIMSLYNVRQKIRNCHQKYPWNKTYCSLTLLWLCSCHWLASLTRAKTSWGNF